MNMDDRMITALRVWWIAFGMDGVSSDKLLQIEAIHGGFIWSAAAADGILTRINGELALTQKALDLIKEYDHGH